MTANSVKTLVSQHLLRVLIFIGCNFAQINPCMKKVISLIFLTIAVLGNTTMQAQHIFDYETGQYVEGDPLDRAYWPTTNTTSTEDGRSDEYCIRYAVIMDSPWYEDCVRWLIPGMIYSDWEGLPEVPVDGYSFALPNGYKSINITIVEAEYKDYNFELQPSLPPVAGDDPQRFVDIEPYEGFFPTAPFCDNGVGKFRDTYIAYVGVRPVAYDYQNKVARAYTRIKCKIEYSKESASVPDVVNDDTNEPQYFSLQGLQIKEPQKGNLYIVRRGSQVTKIIY